MPGICEKSRRFVFLQRRELFLFVIYSLFLVSYLLFLSPNNVFAATIYWDGGAATTNWSSSTNWSGDYVPNATDTVVFGSTSTKSLTIDQNVTVLGIDIQATYSTGTITQGTSTITITQNGFSMASGTFIGGSAIIDINDSGFTLSGGYFSAPSSTGSASSIDVEVNFTISGGTFSATNATTTFNGINSSDSTTVTCSGLLSGTVVINKGSGTDNFTVASGCAIDLGTNPTTNLGDVSFTNNGTINASGTWTLAGGSINLTNNGTIIHSGTGWDFNEFGFIQASTATTTFNGTTITITGDFTYGGTLDLLGKTVTLDGSFHNTIFNCSAQIPGNVTINKVTTGITLLNSNCTINGDFTRIDGVVNSSSGLTTLTVLGNFSVGSSDRFGQSSSTLSFASSGIQYASSTGVPWGGPLNVSSTSGFGELRLSSNFLASSTCDVVQGILSLSGRNLTCGGAFTVQDGGTLRLQGGETVTTPTFQATSTLLFTGDGDGVADFYTITSFSTSVTHLVVSSTDSQDGFLIAAPLDLNGNFSFATGTVSASTTINIGGNWTNSSTTFNRGTSTVIFDGAGTSLLTGTTTFNNLQATTAGKTLQFAAGQTFTVSSTLTLTGASGNNILLRSGTDGTEWRINPQGTVSVSFLDIKNSNNVNSTAIDCPASGCTDSGGNTNWTFSVASTGGGGGGGGGSPSTPSLGSFSVVINNGSAETTSTTLSLTFGGGIDSFWVDFGEDSSFGSGKYKREIYQGIEKKYTHVLSTSTPRTYTIYARFWNQSLSSPSQTVSDTIILKEAGGSGETILPPSEPITPPVIPTEPILPPPTTTPVGFQFTSPLFFGLKSSEVGYLQVLLSSLKEIYPEGLVTNYFGNLTKEAVKRLQCRYNIVCDLNSSVWGYVGPKTREILNGLIQTSSSLPVVPLSPTIPQPPQERPTPPPAFSETKTVQQLQNQLNLMRNQLKQLIELRLKQINQELKNLE